MVSLKRTVYGVASVDAAYTLSRRLSKPLELALTEIKSRATAWLGLIPSRNKGRMLPPAAPISGADILP